MTNRLLSVEMFHLGCIYATFAARSEDAMFGALDEADVARFHTWRRFAEKVREVAIDLAAASTPAEQAHAMDALKLAAGEVREATANDQLGEVWRHLAGVEEVEYIREAV